MSKQGNAPSDLFAGQQGILNLCEEIIATIRSYTQVRGRLIILYDLSTNYFGRQDQCLLTDLRLRHQNDSRALKMLEFWEIDLKDIKIKVVTFFEKYTGDFVIKPRGSFGKEFLELHKALKARFEIENNYLFALMR